MRKERPPSILDVDPFAIRDRGRLSGKGHQSAVVSGEREDHLSPIRDRRRPRGLPLPHHRAYGSRTRRFGRLSRYAQNNNLRAHEPERLLSPRQPQFHPRRRTCVPQSRRMHDRGSLANDFSSLSTPRGEPFRPSATRVTYYALCRLLPLVQLGSRLAQLAWVNSLAPTARQISRGKTRYLRCIDAGFTKCTPTADGGLRGHVPARPGCITPHIRFLFVVPPLWVRLPSDPASRQRPCRFPSLRLCENLAVGLPPT